jgi:IS5 family transposase
VIKYIPASQLTLEGFNTPFDNNLSARNRWVVMAGVIPWDKLAAVYYRHMASSTGAPTLSARMVIGAVIIKHILDIDDREVVEQIQENIYLQYFVGFSSFQIEPAFDPSLLVAIRKRLGKTVMDQFNELILKEAGVISAEKEVKAEWKKEVSQSRKDNAIEPKSIAENPAFKAEAPINEEQPPVPNSGTLMVDATVAEQQIEYPTDVKLLNECRQQLERIITTGCIGLGIELPRMYKKIARKKYLNLAKKKRKSAKDIRKGIRQQLQYVKRDLGYINSLMKQSAVMDKVLSPRDRKLLDTIRQTYRQQFSMFTQEIHSIENRIVSIYQPHVRPIPRGKDRVSTEFGSKQLIMLKDGFTHVEAISWDNFNEGTRLQECLETYKTFYGCYPEKVQADQIFGNRDNRAYMKQRGIKYIGRALGRPTAESKQQEGLLQKEMTQRNAIEGKFGQGKNAYGLAKIKARLKDTSESWISSIYFVMNLLKLVQVHFLSFFYKLLYRISQLMMNIKWNNAEILALETDGGLIQV